MNINLALADRFLISREGIRLTQRESDVLQHLAGGHTYKEIAAQLSISVNTLRTHIKRIYTKLGAHSRTEAVVTTLRAGSINLTRNEYSRKPVLRSGQPAMRDALPPVLVQ